VKHNELLQSSSMTLKTECCRKEQVAKRKAKPEKRRESENRQEKGESEKETTFRSTICIPYP
jgi:hypothetical protein